MSRWQRISDKPGGLWRRVLCAVDFSPTAKAAAMAAGHLAGEGGVLFLVHVHEPVPVAFPDLLPDLPQEGENLVAKLDRRLQGWASAIETAASVHPQLLTGRPAMEIVEFAREHSCDLVVVGTHARSGVRRLVLGSVAELVLRTAPCPVLVIPPPAAEQLLRAEEAKETAREVEAST